MSVGLEWVGVGEWVRVGPIGQVGVMPFGRDTSIGGAAEWPAVPFEHAGVPGFAAET